MAKRKKLVKKTKKKKITRKRNKKQEQSPNLFAVIILSMIFCFGTIFIIERGINLDFIDTIFKNDSGNGSNTNNEIEYPENLTFYCSFDDSINADYGLGNLTGIATGNASVSDGKLNLAYDDVRYVDYNTTNNVDSQQTGCIRLKFTSNYSGSPSVDRTMFIISKAHADSKNLIHLRRRTTGMIQLYISDLDGTIIMNVDVGPWFPVVNNTYEFELNWDLTIGSTRLFIEGGQLGITITATGTRDSNIGIFRLGSNVAGVDKFNGWIDDVMVFNAVQHTSNYTPSATVF